MIGIDFPNRRFRKNASCLLQRAAVKIRRADNGIKNNGSSVEKIFAQFDPFRIGETDGASAGKMKDRKFGGITAERGKINRLRFIFKTHGFLDSSQKLLTVGGHHVPVEEALGHAVGTSIVEVTAPDDFPDQRGRRWRTFLFRTAQRSHRQRQRRKRFSSLTALSTGLPGTADRTQIIVFIRRSGRKAQNGNAENRKYFFHH